jgi:hypothetical protein
MASTGQCRLRSGVGRVFAQDDEEVRGNLLRRCLEEPDARGRDVGERRFERVKSMI